MKPWSQGWPPKSPLPVDLPSAPHMHRCFHRHTQSSRDGTLIWPHMSVPVNTSPATHTLLAHVQTHRYKRQLRQPPTSSHQYTELTQARPSPHAPTPTLYSKLPHTGQSPSRRARGKAGVGVRQGGRSAPHPPPMGGGPPARVDSCPLAQPPLKTLGGCYPATEAGPPPLTHKGPQLSQAGREESDQREGTASPPGVSAWEDMRHG